MLKAFEEANIEFEYISGTSSGSIIATLYACGYKSDEIYELFKKYCKEIKYVDYKNIIKMILGLIIRRKIVINGLTSGDKIEKIVSQACKEKNICNINEVKKQLIIPSVDLHTGKVYMFQSKSNRDILSDSIEYINDINIGKAVRASCSYPGAFCPMKYDNTELIDGGIRENVPWKELKKIGADKVISVVFESELKENKCCQNIIEVVASSIDILSHELSNYELLGADYLIKIRTEKVSLLDMSKIDMLYKIGYEIGKNEIERIGNLL